MEKYRVGLVGCGGMGRSHLKTLGGMEEFEVVGLYDIAESSIGQAREICGEVGGYDDFGEMYDELKPDVVTVATQTRGHHGPTVAALERGISVLCEKPIAIDLVEADAMVAAGERSGAKLAINQQNHVNPAVRKGQEMLREGVVGELVTVRGRNKCGRKSGNEFTEMGTHVADMMLCFGGEPEWCAASSISSAMQYKHTSTAHRPPLCSPSAKNHRATPTPLYPSQNCEGLRNNDIQRFQK